MGRPLPGRLMDWGFDSWERKKISFFPEACRPPVKPTQHVVTTANDKSFCYIKEGSEVNKRSGVGMNCCFVR